MKVKLLGLALIAAGLAVGCGKEDLNKDFKPTSKDVPMPTAAGASNSAQTTTAPSPP